MPANFTLFFVVIFIGATWWGWQWPYIAKMMPLYVAAIPGLVLSILQLWRDASGWEKRRAESESPESIEMDETHNVKMDKRTELMRTLTFFGWFIAGAAGIWLVGIVFALPALVCLYMLVEGREGILPTAIMTLGTYGVVWGLFEYTLEMRWPPGILIGY